ncbi:hypothetical protein LOTGIDRAFT_108200 [Lottia gigantea]|uniref:G-protein coupled receptors family 1 profile domain-containing protein n=1 Tax=Lottia gigantea TaxID=225164 RepID=V3ZTB9_LOTGI|nr:hypothetical protein LOTGIDRAFT_108200 [Lottia gigantea]ESO84146.1 hypothetical protein LOTGIDRAFT_108200 [Lottia gigantea]
MTESDERILQFEFIVRVTVPTIFGVIFLLGLVGNIVVILVVIGDKHMRNTTNILILNLAIADLFFIVFCVPFTASGYAIPFWPFGNIWCKVVQYMINVCAYASVYTLVLMSLDRYLAVVHAIRSMRYRTERNTSIAVILTWVVISVCNIPLLLMYEEYPYEHFNEKRSACLNVEELKNANVGRMFYGVFFAFGYILPLGAVCVMYGLMLKRLLYGIVPGGNQSAESVRAKKRVTRMVIIVVVLFAVCWLPIQVILVIQKFGTYPTDIFYIGLQMASNCLAYMNSCVNPILYAFLSENFRRSFRKVLCCFSPQIRKNTYERASTRIVDEKTKNTTVPGKLNNENNV